MARSLDPLHYLGRESSLLAFNRRVLEQARDPAVPLLERLRFLTISSTNLDEFFEIRVSRLRNRAAFGLPAPGPGARAPQEILTEVAVEAHDLVAAQYRVLHDELLPALDSAGIRLLRAAAWNREQIRWARACFRTEVAPVLTPIGLDPAHPFPHVQNKNLCLIFTLDGPDAFGRTSGIAVLQVPRALPRVLALPAGRPGARDFVLLSTLIEAHAPEIFPGMRVTGCAHFRVTRDSDVWIAEEEAEDLLETLQGELHRRGEGDATRLEVGAGSPVELERLLLGQFDLGHDDLYRVDEPVNLHRLAALCDLAERPDLRYPPHVPRPPRTAAGQPVGDVHAPTPVDWFEVLRRGDVLLHHPYESMAPVLELLRQAAVDPQVVAIKQTLYRTGTNSPVVAILLDAARAGKEVTAVVELRARFDEEANIDLAQRLQDAGANVAYGVVGHKTHGKMLLILRREGAAIRRYLHLGTGNYHPGTARLYTDLGLLTADPALGEDAHQLFQQLTGLGRVRKLTRLLQAPFTLQARLLELIAAEAAAARKGEPARILAKMNALTDPEVIAALYAAAQAGVEIDLIVRGICCLRPGVPGLSERIRVRSIIGRFLEHARVCLFHAGGRERVFAGSADWMERNFLRRVEVVFPILDPALQARVVEECLTLALRDNTQAWLLGADGKYVRARPAEGEAAFCLQAELAARRGEAGAV